ncbi:MAG: amidohydrolase family protein [Candidatus Heimdallarchaeota archaeon]|nr:amidohydrolase family protein [Candidatus Heimdallarchaeota archaeon]
MTVEDDLKNTAGFSHIKFKYVGPKWDAHVHLYKIEDTTEFVKYASEYNVEKFTAIIRGKRDEYEEVFPNKFKFARFINTQNLFTNDIQAVLDDIEDIYNSNFKVVKFWYAPRWRSYIEEQFKVKVEGFRIDNAKFDPIYKKIEDLGLKFLIHVSDPDILYTTKYQPESYYGSKRQHMEEFENIVSKFPNLQIQGAHMGGQPEHLDDLARWFDKYPNFYVDTSSAKWMAREFSYHPDTVREFFITYKDRLFFGTDIVTGRTDREPIPGYYYLRYLSLQALLETPVEQLPLPLEDPDNNNKTVINGLDLPMDVLRSIYWDNCNKFFK